MSSSLIKSDVESLASTAVDTLPAQAYSIIPTQEEKTIVEVRPAHAGANTPPLYSAKLSTKEDPDVLIWQGSNTSSKPVASAHVDKATMTALLTLNGETMHMGTNPKWGSTKVQHPKYGKLKWKVRMSGNPGTLVDEHDVELAKHKTVGMHYGGGPRELTLLQPCEADFFEVVLLTVILSRRLSGIAQENAAIIGAVV